MAKSRQLTTKGSDSIVRYLPCQAEPGMFRGELLVYANGFDPEKPDKSIRIQMLVDENEVEGIRGVPKRNQPAAGWLRVTLAGKINGLCKIILPQPATSRRKSVGKR